MKTLKHLKANISYVLVDWIKRKICAMNGSPMTTDFDIYFDLWKGWFAILFYRNEILNELSIRCDSCINQWIWMTRFVESAILVNTTFCETILQRIIWRNQYKLLNKWKWIILVSSSTRRLMQNNNIKFLLSHAVQFII